MLAVTHKRFWLLVGALLLSACGGGGSEPGDPAPSAPVAAVVGPAGGTVTGPDGVQVIIPAGALRAPTTNGIARDASAAPAPDPLWPTSAHVYEFTPHGVVFDAPVTIRLPVPPGTTEPTLRMAGTDHDWTTLEEAVVADGFASVQRNTFSWGVVVGGCAIPANAPPNPDRCFSPRGHSTVVANPAGALTRIGYSNAYGSGGTFRLDAAATLTFSAAYNMWPSCASARLTFYRRQLDRQPQVLETLFDQIVGLSPGGFPGSTRGSGGSATFPSISLSHLDQGRHVYAAYVSCQRADGHTFRYFDAQVIDVLVPVPATTQTIGGNVTGLAGTVVLRNNGGDDLSLSADGAFTFPTPVATGTPYLVTVGTQPAGQVCTVQNGSGAASADVGNVAVNCSSGGGARNWRGEALMGTIGTAHRPSIAADAQGNAIAVWMQHDGTRHNIWANRYASGGAWGTPQLIESGDGNAEHPVIAVDGAGNATAIWSQHDGSAMSIRSASYTGGTWGADEPVESDAGNASAPHLGMDASGNALAVWVWQDGGQRRIRANRRVGGTWQTQTSIDGAIGLADAPQVAVLPSGFALAVWIQAEGGRQHIYHNAFNGTGWSSADRLHENTTYSIDAPRIAANASGGAIVVWEQGNGGASATDILAARYSGGLWNPPVTLSDVNAQRSFDPRIAMNATGRAAVIWRESHSDAFRTFGRPYAPDGGWALPATRLDAAFVDGSSGGGPLDVGIDALGNAVAIWTYAQPGAQHNDLYASSYDAGAMAWSAPQPIENTSGDGINTCSIAVDANGNAVAVWEQDDGLPPHGDIWSNVFR